MRKIEGLLFAAALTIFSAGCKSTPPPAPEQPAKAAPAETTQPLIYVTNEVGGDLSIIDSGNYNVVATVPLGKRPRGIHASPDGKTIYVAVSGTPISAPPKLDAKGNPIFEKGKDDDDDDAKADKAADGIVVVDVASRKVVR